MTSNDPERPELQKSGGSVTRPDREHMSADAGEERDVLLPCPFCGGPAEYSDVGGEHFVVCNACICTVTDATKQLAIIAWNTRSPSPDLFREGVEAAAKVCEERARKAFEWQAQGALTKAASAIRALSRK